MARALNDAKQGLSTAQVRAFDPPGVSTIHLQAIKRHSRSTCPTTRESDAFRCLFMSRISRSALVKHHYDVGAKRCLYFHRHLWRKELHTSINMRTELSTFFGDFS